MGASPYFYFTPYDPDAGAALQRLRQQEFRAGRYNPAMPFIAFPVNHATPSPGAKHASIDAAIEAAAEDGTRSILDVERLVDEPQMAAASPLEAFQLEDLYGTAEPTHEMVDDNMDFFDGLARGYAIYFTVYKGGKPDELFFAGYSFD